MNCKHTCERRAIKVISTRWRQFRTGSYKNRKYSCTPARFNDWKPLQCTKHVATDSSTCSMYEMNKCQTALSGHCSCEHGKLPQDNVDYSQ